MFGERLVDLDELTLRCRNEAAKQYIAESVACYRAGAFRASIVATWVAIVFDFLHKLDELALTGDAGAVQKRNEYETIRRNADVRGSLQFEEGLLAAARDQFEFISPVEFQDLERLKEDRNRCAHPSMTSYDEIYQPSAELTRYHLRNAVTHLLQHPPVQGRAALERIMRDIDSPYFPITVDDAVRSMQLGPLVRPRRSLLRNLVVVILKSLLRDEMDSKAFQRYSVALSASRQMHRVDVEAVLGQDFARIVQGIEVNYYPNIVRFLASVPDTWHYLPPNIVNVVEQYIRDMPIANNEHTFYFLLEFQPLKTQAFQRLSELNPDEVANLIAHRPNAALLDRAMAIYNISDSFNYANRIGERLISPLTPVMTTEHFSRITEIAANNSQVAGSHQFITILGQIKQYNRVSEIEFRQALVDLAVRSWGLREILLPFFNDVSVEDLLSSIARDEESGGVIYAQMLLKKVQQRAILTEERAQELDEQYRVLLRQQREE